jgi:AbrB family looped-hinge helix DNA binding protein
MYARVTAKGQVTIPQEIRKRLKLEKGSLLSFTIKNGKAEIVPIKEDVMALMGSVRVDGPQDFDAIEAEVEKRIAEDAIREA